jgi:hypothetical protein
VQNNTRQNIATRFFFPDSNRGYALHSIKEENQTLNLLINQTKRRLYGHTTSTNAYFVENFINQLIHFAVPLVGGDWWVCSKVSQSLPLKAG